MERLEFGGLDSYLRGKDKNGFNNGMSMLLHAFYGKGGPRPPLNFSKGGPF